MENVKRSSTQEIYRLTNHGTFVPPDRLVQILVSLGGAVDAIVDAAASRANTDDSTTWTVLGRTQTNLIYVRATADLPNWSGDENPNDMPSMKLDSAWTRPLTDIDALVVTDVDYWRHGFSDEWNWRCSWALTVDGMQVEVPASGRAESFVDGLRPFL